MATKITEDQYNRILANTEVSDVNKEALRSQSTKSEWVFVGTDFD